MNSDMSGMGNMPSTSSNTSMSMSMKMYFHGSIGSDMLWFKSWMPTSAGATVGVCIALFLFAIFERYLMAFRRACDAAWYAGQTGFTRPKSSGPLSSSTGCADVTPSLPPRSASSTQSANHDLEAMNDPSSLTTTSSTSSSSSMEKHLPQATRIPHLPKAVNDGMDPAREGRWSRPFKLAVDLPRGLLQAIESLVHYLLMLVVMTFNIWWILCVVIGAGVGEVMFGRFGSVLSGH